MRSRRIVADVLRGPVLLLLAAAAIGCASVQDLAPPVNDQVIELARGRDIAAEQLRQGRTIYVTKCARCHSPEPVVAYSQEQWRAILPRMIPWTGLSPEESAAVESYVMMTLQAHAAAGDDPPGSAGAASLAR